MTSKVAMMLGPFAFEALGFGYQDIQRVTNTKWVDVPVAQTLNKQQWTGPTSEDVTIKGVIFPLEFGGQSQLDGIISAANSGQAMIFVSGDVNEGRIHGTFTVQSVNEDRSYHDASGDARKNSYNIKLKRYGSGAEVAGNPITTIFG